MTIAEYYEIQFKNKQMSSFQEHKDEIINYLNNCKDKLDIEYVSQSFDDLFRFSKNLEHYFDDYKINQIINNKLITSSESIKLIKDSMKNIDFSNLEYVNIPKELLDIIKPFELKKLKKLKLDGNFNKDEIELLLGKTKADELTIDGKIDDDIFDKFKGIIYVGKPYIGKYNNKKLINVHNNIGNNTELYSKDYLNDLDYLLNLYNMNNNGDSFNIYNEVNNDIGINIVPKISYNRVKKNDFETDFEYLSDFNKLVINEPSSISEISFILDTINKNNIPVDKVLIKLENKSYDDLDQLMKLSGKYDIKLRYSNEFVNVSVNQFITMRATLDYYKNLIEEADLSPLEKATYAYDIIKSYVYKEVEKNEDKLTSRKIYSIIESGKIVCVGYANFYAQLMKELGVNGYAVSTIVEDNGKEFGHERTILDIQDSKYNINGLYAFDPTWDSAKDIVVVKASDGNKYLRSKVLGNLKDDDIILHEYDNIVRYGYFLIGKDEYKDVFKNEAPVPDINRDFNNYYGDKNDEITTQLSNKTLSIDNFIRLMATVKKEEGYSKDALKNELIDIVSFNRLRNELYNGKSKQVDELNNMISELEEQNRIKNDDSIKKQ